MPRRLCRGRSGICHCHLPIGPATLLPAAQHWPALEGDHKCSQVYVPHKGTRAELVTDSELTESGSEVRGARRCPSSSQHHTGIAREQRCWLQEMLRASADAASEAQHTRLPCWHTTALSSRPQRAPAVSLNSSR